MLTPEWLNLEKSRVNEILNEVGYAYPIKPPLPIYDIIEAFIGDVNIVIPMDYNFPEGVSALATKDMNYGWLVVVDGRECIERQRFSAAHELAHMVLFPNQPQKVFCSHESRNDYEKLCDRFAGDLLMPETLIRDLYTSNPFPYLEDIAKIFKVSRPVAEIQLKRLGLPFQWKTQLF